MIEIRHATPQDIQEFYSAPREASIRAVSVVYKGEIAAIAGVNIHNGYAFSDVKEGVSKYAIWRYAKSILQCVRDMGATKATSVLGNESSNRFVEKLGLVPIGSADNQILYRM